ncbi:hypothetical protein CFN78_13930 [Amycolatopsis antarctica]|uniref:Uncharacterized protein n=1 Tax=Amycolatopsis antarctica TaxID=1854586 RepID=A0A263D3C6_9PSEU|nr:hypothetical protein [Amycolatopsis antarctica]OZM72719.1 hypothetical protein CFN78_13930 [Amycolatopsis antarctica]
MASDNDFRAALDNAARQALDVIGRIHEDARAGLDTNYWVARTELNGKSRRVSLDEQLGGNPMAWFAGQGHGQARHAQPPQPPMQRQPEHGYGYQDYGRQNHGYQDHGRQEYGRPQHFGPGRY